MRSASRARASCDGEVVERRRERRELGRALDRHRIGMLAAREAAARLGDAMHRVARSGARAGSAASAASTPPTSAASSRL